MARSIEVFALLSLVVVALSHIFRPTAWAAYFDLLRRQGAAGVMVNGMMALSFGAIIVSFHNVWSGPAIVVTLLGWAQVLKGALHLCIPGIGERSLGLVRTDANRKFVAAGIVMLLLSLVVAFALLREAGAS
jgi:hypothetical protein